MTDQVQRDRYKKAGFVQVSAWVPADKVQEIYDLCTKYRNEHIQRQFWVLLDKGGVDEQA